MKASEYLEKFGDAVFKEWSESETETKELAKLMHCFISEMQDAIKARNIKRDTAAVALIKEYNQKWNALAALFVKVYGHSVIRRDGFYNTIRDEIKQLPPLNTGE